MFWHWPADFMSKKCYFVTLEPFERFKMTHNMAAISFDSKIYQLLDLDMITI